MAWSDCVIDVSHFQGAIDWRKVDSGIVLVFVKATQGAHYKDPMFRENRDGVLASGRMCVPYHFLTAEDVDAQIENFEKVLNDGQPFMLDWEGRPHSTLDAEDVDYMGAQMIDDLGVSNLFGYWGTSTSWPGVPTRSMQAWVKFTPRYPHVGAQNFETVPHLQQGLVRDPLWQYTQWGRVAGIPVNVDRSVFNGTPDELRALYASMAKGIEQ